MQQVATPIPLIRRSKLVVSALAEDAVEEAARSGADALIVDLDQTFPEEVEARGRAEAREVLSGLSRTGSDLFLRVSPAAVSSALEDFWVPRLAGVVVVADRAAEVKAVDASLAARERGTGLLQLDLVLATSQAILDVYDLAAASSRVVSLTLDEDSLLAELGSERSVEVDQLLYARGRIVIVARLFGIQAHGWGFIPGAASPLQRATIGRKIGLRGALSYDATDVAALNQGFSPAEDEVEHAHRVIAAMEEAVRRGKGSASLPGGAMVDMAMFKHAQAVLRWVDAIKAREAAKAARE